MDFLIGVAKALLPQHNPPPRHTPCPAVFFSYYCFFYSSQSEVSRYMRDKRKSYTYSTRDRYSIAAARFIASHSDWIMALMRTGQELVFWRGPLSIAFITSITVPAPRRRTPSSNIFPMLSADFVILPLCGTVQPHLAIFTIKGSILVYMQHLLK